MRDQVPDAVKKVRHQALETLGESMKQEFAESMRGKFLPVIFETVDKNGLAHGWSDNYIAVTAPADQAALGRIVDFKL